MRVAVGCGDDQAWLVDEGFGDERVNEGGADRVEVAVSGGGAGGDEEQVVGAEGRDRVDEGALDLSAAVRREDLVAGVASHEKTVRAHRVLVLSEQADDLVVDGAVGVRADARPSVELGAVVGREVEPCNRRGRVGVETA